MSTSDVDFVPPPAGPPPPEVPPGWVARWDSRYNTFFYVNLVTKQSQWEKPTGTTDPTSSSFPTPDPPSYSQAVHNRAPEKSRDYEPPFDYGRSQLPRDEKLHTPPQTYSTLITPTTASQYPLHIPGTFAPRSPTPTPPNATSSKSHSSGLSSKISKFLSHSRSQPQQQPFSAGQYYPTTQPQPYYGTGAPYQQSMLYGYPHPQMVYSGAGQPAPQRQGMSAGGAAALGLGGGLLGGMMLGEALGGHEYAEGFEDGADFGEDFDGGDF
ncbi:hypothetical protein EV426DRAFT_572558 [Tirmania nivea]|nr:hypothetical protein EV426DRAFT_572558 [Tirmania nivea]